MKNRRLPLLNLELNGSPSHSRTGKKQNLMLEGELHPSFTRVTNSSSPAATALLYAQLFLPRPSTSGTVSFGSDPESLAAASKDGRTVLAVTLEWAPQ